MRWSPCCFQITRMAHLTSSILGDCMDVAYWSLLWLNHSRLSRESIFIRPYQKWLLRLSGPSLRIIHSTTAISVPL